MDIPQAQRGTVLIIESSIDTRLLVSLSLQAAGYYALTAASGEEAMQIAKHAIPDVILMDLDMPQRDGFGATRRLRQMPELRHVPVVAVTAYPADGIRQAARDVGCSGYIKKPFDYERLGWLLDRVMSLGGTEEFVDCATGAFEAGKS
jgi:two-component system cell cycle response regulator DivK